MADQNPNTCFYLVGAECFCSKSVFFQKPCQCRGRGCSTLEPFEKCGNDDDQTKCFRTWNERNYPDRA